LIRHGPTEWNALRRFQGRTDMPLSVHGRAAARAIAETLHSEAVRPDLFERSCARGGDGAHPRANLAVLTLRLDERLREFDLGAGRSDVDEIIAANPQLAGLGSTAVKLYAPKEANRSHRSPRRVAPFLDQLRSRIFGRRVVTHAGVLHAFFFGARLAHRNALNGGRHNANRD